MFSRSKRFPEPKIEDTPGPGHYNVKYDAVKKNPTAIAICRTPRFPNECRSKNCQKCALATSVSSPCPRKRPTRSLNSSMNSSFESFSLSRGRLGSSFRNDGKFQKCKDLTGARRKLQNLAESVSSLESNGANAKIVRRKKTNGGVILAPTCIMVNDPTDTEDEIAEPSKTESTESLKSGELSSLRDSGYHHLSDGASVTSSICSEKAPSDGELPPYSELQAISSENLGVYSGKAASVEGLPPYSDSNASSRSSTASSPNNLLDGDQHGKDGDLPDCCAFTSDGKRCEIFKKKNAALKMRELEKMLEMHRLGMQKMYELVSEVRQTVEK